MAVIQIHAIMSPKPGAEDALRDALAAATVLTKEHAGVLSYQFYATADGSRFVALETYRDLESFQAHVASVGDAMGAVMEAVAEMTMSVLGEVPDELKEAMKPFAPAYYEHVVGFTAGA